MRVPFVNTLTRPCIEPFGNPSFQADDCTTGSTSPPNPFNGSLHKGFLSVAGSLSVPNGNYTYYDEYTKAVSPMIMTMWPKNSTTSWAPDTRVFCITADEIEAGSRVPSSAMFIHPEWLFVYALGVVMIAGLALL
jgi:hypothetical protein